MRFMLGLTVLAATVAVGACKSGDPMEKARKQISDMCRSSPPPGLDADKYCTCVVDKSVGTKSASQWSRMSEKEGEQLGIQAASECMAQFAPASPGAPVGQAPAAAAQESGAAVEEAVDKTN